MAISFRVTDVALDFIACPLRLPLKFGAETIEKLYTGRVKLTVEDASGRRASGWGETPLSAAWGWPSRELSYLARENRMKDFCRVLADAWRGMAGEGHAFDLGHDFLETRFPELAGAEKIPHLAALISLSLFDIALHDAYGNLVGKPVYETYNASYMAHDLGYFYDDPAFQGLYPEDFFVKKVPTKLPVWHLVGGKDLLTEAELTGKEPQDGYPVILTDWIRRDGLKCLKVKLTGSDEAWDYERMKAVGKIALEYGVEALSPDFNCLVKEPAYVNRVLDRLKQDHPAIHDLILYVEQPFPYDLEANRIDVHSVSARKPLFMDESAHDWKFVRMGFELGWTGVALKVCKTQTGALLSACWAKQHKMQLMVQDLTNPMLAMVPHVELAAHIGTIRGVECNAPQFYPEASRREEAVHPYLYRRRDGVVDLSTLHGNGFGYALGLD